MNIFDAKKAKETLPVDKARDMRQNGQSDHEIVQTLQREGNDPNQVLNAMNHADMKGGEAIIPDENYYNQQPRQDAPVQQAYGGGDVERVEEVAEAIIDEKWNELVKNINKIVEWKEATETRITAIEQGVKDLKGDFDALHKGVLGKIGEYDQNITSIGTEIKAMEKVFQKVLPTFTENVNELTRVTTDIKKSYKK